jgi:hypothetical protein
MLKKKLLAASRTNGTIMTLPDERYRAVMSAQRLLVELCDPSKTPRVPKVIRARAAGVLRHYPNEWDMDRAAKHCDHVFQSPNPVEDIVEFLREGRVTK